MKPRLYPGHPNLPTAKAGKSVHDNNPMKPHFKPLANHLQTAWRKAIILHFTFSILHSTFAAVPLSWQVTPRNPAPITFDRHHGETLEFRCTFAGFGELPFGAAADIRLWYQTNGMSAAWWSVPASVSSNVLSATFPPQADPGADRLSLFFGAPSNAYASAVLRLRHSPGFAPNVLPPPEQAAFEETDPVFSTWLATTNLVYAESDPTVPAWAKAENPPASSLTTNDVCGIVTNETAVAFAAWKCSPCNDFDIEWVQYTGWVGGIYYDSVWCWQAYKDGLNFTIGDVPPEKNFTNQTATVLVFYDDIRDVNITATRQRITQNALGLARLIDLPPLTNGIPDAAARAVYDVHDLMWDATESILYWHKMRGGHDEYIAVTNIDLTHPSNAAALKAWREANR